MYGSNSGLVYNEIALFKWTYIIMGKSRAKGCINNK